MPHRGTVGAVKACTRLRGVSVVGGVSRVSQTGAFAQTQSRGGGTWRKSTATRSGMAKGDSPDFDSSRRRPACPSARARHNVRVGTRHDAEGVGHCRNNEDIALAIVPVLCIALRPTHKPICPAAMMMELNV